jgi:hypothetical protein
MNATIRVFLALALAASTYATEAQDKRPGKWVKGSFAQYNLWCTQAWQCVPSQNVLHSPQTRVETTPADSTQGVCNAAGGPADSCNVCSASQPKSPCLYWTVPR